MIQVLSAEEEKWARADGTRLSYTESLTHLEEKLRHLDKGKRRELVALVRKNQSLFTDVPQRPKSVVHDVDVGGSKPIKQNAYRLSPEKRKIMRQEVEYLLANNNPAWYLKAAPATLPQLPAQQPVFVQPQLPSQPRAFIPLPQQVSPLLPPFTFRPTSSLCNHAAKPLVDEVEDGRAYHFSWCHDSGRLYTWEQATYYCSGLGNGFQAVSIESLRKQELISRFMIAHYISDIWTSGNKRNSRSWSWLSGTSSPYSNWSSTGRRGLPQPDNDEGNEDCLAVLNNQYNDGVTWHDSSCFHLRRVICEAPRFYVQ
nr:collectin-12-like [Procambarus clarkii]